MPDHYKATDSLHIGNGVNTNLNSREAIIANAARQEAFAEIDAAADDLLLEHAEFTAQSTEKGGTAVFAGSGVVSDGCGPTFTAALLAASKRAPFHPPETAMTNHPPKPEHVTVRQTLDAAHAAGIQEGRKQALAEVDEWDRGHLKTDKETDQ